MRNQTIPRIFAILAVAMSLTALPAAAQATRTWVSGVGDDANPCSRTAPCKTFAGAISKTATGGEINVLDPGGFGAVTITKSITISAEGVEAGVLVSGTNAIIINAVATSNVVLRGLDIEGLGTGLVGIKVLGALGSLTVENCTIHNFRGSNGSGIELSPTTAGTTRFFIKDTQVRNNGQGTGVGILVNPAAGVTLKGHVENVRMENNAVGLKLQGPGNSNVSVNHSEATGSTFAGFAAAASGVVLTIESSVSAHNATGVRCDAGTFVKLGGMNISDNPTGNITGTCSSYGNNNIDTAVALSPLNQQ
jgi:hypothetical protein